MEVNRYYALHILVTIGSMDPDMVTTILPNCEASALDKKEGYPNPPG